MQLSEPVLALILKVEGGYVNNPADPGGATNYGVTQAVYHAWRSSQGLPPRAVKLIEPEEVRRIYTRDYWHAGGCSAFPESHQKLALTHMDACVNHGIRQAGRFLQRALRFDEKHVDGRIGPKTISAVAECDELRTIAKYLDIRAAFYRTLATRPGQAQFLPGWLARLRHVARATGVPINRTFAKEPV